MRDGRPHGVAPAVAPTAALTMWLEPGATGDPCRDRAEGTAMSLREDVRVQSPLVPPRPGIPALVHVTAALLAAGFATTSALISLLPAFAFESQFPVLLPFFAWAAATGVSQLTTIGRGMLEEWRSALGVASVVPYAALMMTAATLPGFRLPWWLAPVAGVAAAFPFAVCALRARGVRRPVLAGGTDETSARGTFLVGLGLMLMAYAVSGPDMAGSVIAVLLAVALSMASMLPRGLAHAGRTWRLRQWVALAWGTTLVWASALVAGLTGFFHDPWYVFSVVVAAGVPLVLINSAEQRRGRAA